MLLLLGWTERHQTTATVLCCRHDSNKGLLTKEVIRLAKTPFWHMITVYHRRRRPLLVTAWEQTKGIHGTALHTSSWRTSSSTGRTSTRRSSLNGPSCVLRASRAFYGNSVLGEHTCKRCSTARRDGSGVSEASQQEPITSSVFMICSRCKEVLEPLLSMLAIGTENTFVIVNVHRALGAKAAWPGHSNQCVA
jgi:hypothetical protein